MLPLTPHVLRIQTSRHRGVRRALDDRAAVGEQRYLKRILPELEHEGVVTDLAKGYQSPAHFIQVNRAGVLVNLHRVAPAERDVSAAFSREMRKLPAHAGAAVGARRGGGNLCPLIT